MLGPPGQEGEWSRSRAGPSRKTSCNAWPRSRTCTGAGTSIRHLGKGPSGRRRSMVEAGPAGTRLGGPGVGGGAGGRRASRGHLAAVRSGGGHLCQGRESCGGPTGGFLQGAPSRVVGLGTPTLTLEPAPVEWGYVPLVGQPVSEPSSRREEWGCFWPNHRQVMGRAQCPQLRGLASWARVPKPPRRTGLPIGGWPLSITTSWVLVRAGRLS